ncbi:Pr6Pr family membrane protein [Ottowia sp.]|uniref:Pr6Pr family membrane protein n=1 Tax=Ottowia sp. TaxID=1898956 RepID=UPI002617DAEA|nr:Pr6Pr family membrane protein [Ottowia sp.]
MPMLLTAVRALLALLALAAIGQQLRLHVAASHGTLNFFSYFTNLSNLFAALVLVVSVVCRPSRGAPLDLARYLSAVNMAVVGLVFAALLRNADLGDLLPWVNFVLHYVMPVAVVLDWLLEPPRQRLNATRLALALVFPLVYLAYTLLRGAAGGWYPYPFLNPANVGGYGGVALYAVGIFLTFLVVGSGLLAAGNRLGRRA